MGRSRPLPLNMIRRLHERFHIPAEVLIRLERKGRALRYARYMHQPAAPREILLGIFHPYMGA